MENPSGRRVEVQERGSELIKHHLPTNVYQYKATISGFPIMDLLLLIISMCISLLLSRVGLIVSVLWASVSILIFFTIWRNKDNRKALAGMIIPKGEKSLAIEASFPEYNGHLFVNSGRFLSIIFHIPGLYILSMRRESQEDLLTGLSDALNRLKSNADFFSLHPAEIGGSSRRFGENHHSYFRITTSLDQSNFASSANKLLNESSELAQYFNKSGFQLVEIGTREVLMDILNRLSGQVNPKNQNKMNGDQIKEKIKARQYANYAKTDKYTTNLVVKNSSSSSGPFYQTLLESMNLPIDIILSIRKASSGNSLQYVNRLLSERKTEYRFSRGMSRETEYLKRQISDLESMKLSCEKRGNKVFDITMAIRIYADHPAILNSRVQRIRTSLELLGFYTEQNSRAILHKLKNFYLYPDRQKYLMDTQSIAGILPIYRDESASADGIVLGIDDLSEKVVRYNPFTQNSYNSLIIGETGSGKSYFTKIFLMRSLQSGICRKVIIFDPLNEYSCKLFGSNCKEYSVGSYVESVLSGIKKTDNEWQTSVYPDIRIIKPDIEELENDEILGEMLAALNRNMIENQSESLLLAIDECHIILRNLSNAKLLGTMIRHSRHYKTSIMNISQNTDDFLSRTSSNIAYNSNRIFIFRTRNISDSHRKVLKIDRFDIPGPENLLGGSHHKYSECVVSDGTYCRTLRVITSNFEDKILKESV